MIEHREIQYDLTYHNVCQERCNACHEASQKIMLIWLLHPTLCARAPTSIISLSVQLVHAQLRECLEDTQVKLEHKSQSAARRLLNSAARLAYEFAKPDRFSSAPRSPGSPSRSRKPRAMSSQSSGGRSPLSKTRGGALRRKKTPEREREGALAGKESVSKEEVVIDFSATM